MITWKEHLKTQGYSDEEISTMEKTFGGEKMAKAFEGPIKAAADAKAAADKANQDLAEFNERYQKEILPEVSKAFQDAINTRTQNAALQERLKAAKDYGFLSDDAAIPGGADPNAGKVPGSGAAPAARANANAVAGSPELDPRYVPVETFTKGVDSIPEMLGRLSKISNEHFHLFGQPLLDIDDLVMQAKNSGGKKNVAALWEEKYKVADKRKELADKKQAEHDKTVGEKAVADYLTQHGGTPFTRPAVPSIATRFTGQSKDDVRKPWKGADDRKDERRQKMLTDWGKARAGAA